MILYSFLKFITPIWLKDIFDYLNLWSVFNFLGYAINRWVDLSRFSFIYYPLKNFLYFISYNVWIKLQISGFSPYTFYKKLQLFFSATQRSREKDEILPFRCGTIREQNTKTYDLLIKILIKFITCLYYEMNLFE